MLGKTFSGGGGRLPAEYQEVEYITAENNSSVWSGFTIERSVWEWKSGDILTFIAKADTVGNNGYATFAHIDRNTANDRASLKLDGSLDLAYFTTISVQVDAQGFTNGEIEANFGVSEKAIFLSFYSAAHAWSSGTITVKYLCVSRNDVKLSELIPCYRKADNVVGMYDIIHDTFYTNEGTGTFTKGGNV